MIIYINKFLFLNIICTEIRESSLVKIHHKKLYHPNSYHIYQLRQLNLHRLQTAHNH